MADDKDADAFTLLYFLTTKQHKKRMGPLLVTWQVINLLVVHFIGQLSLETKPQKVGQLCRSSDAGLIKRDRNSLY